MSDEKLDRRGVLGGLLGGVVLGGGAGFFAGSESGFAERLAADQAAGRTPPPVLPATPAAASGAASAASSAGASSTALDGGADAGGPRVVHPRTSFAQQGEDLAMQSMLVDVFGVHKPTFIDIGAYDPVESNNTFLFTIVGGHGVLVEPNPALTEQLRFQRPGDVVLDVGVGVTDQTEADYYVFDKSKDQLNTFSKEQADAMAKRGYPIEKVIKRRLVKINEILEQNFKDAAPNVFSIDIEGLDLEVLKTMDFARWRPMVFCVETAELDGHVNRGIVDLMASKGYEVRGGSFVNTIFLDTKPRPKKG